MKNTDLGSELGPTRAPALHARLQAALRSPLVRNGYSLVASVGLTSVLGLGYWVFAARLYSVEEVGLNGALISTMTLLSGFAQLNLGSVLTRFLPTAGASAARWILGSYLLATAAALLGCALFFLGVHVWMPTLRFVAEQSWMAMWFVVGTLVWTIFALQDGALTGLRKAIWIPIENTLFGVAKIALLVAFAYSSFRSFGLFASWTAPLLAAVIPVNLLIFRRILPSSLNLPEPHPDTNVRRAALFLGGDFLGTLFLYGAIGGAPILVLEKVGAAANAEYYLTWTITYSLYLISTAMAASLTAEAALHRPNLDGLASQTLVHTMVLLVVAVAILVVGAPLILALFGPAYLDESPALLRILALSALPFGFTSTYLGVARVEGRMGTVAAVQGAMAVLVLGFGMLFLSRFGTIGMAAAWLAAQTIIALALLLFAARKISWRYTVHSSRDTNFTGRDQWGQGPRSLW